MSRVIYVLMDTDLSVPVGVFSSRAGANEALDYLGQNSGYVHELEVDSGLTELRFGMDLWDIIYHTNGVVDAEKSTSKWSGTDGEHWAIPGDHSRDPQDLMVSVWAFSETSARRLAETYRVDNVPDSEWIDDVKRRAG